ncbi:hypothetical protein Zm00014a_015033 [Zea mays]|uniref:Uncharacterized protein n=1 Tax=Zea mays TaxID=4577 RepID=A0A3L6G7H0_MAIZE|nr:hypothetical protein Zm00014a_015033 [Zea mays]
MFSSRTIC